MLCLLVCHGSGLWAPAVVGLWLLAFRLSGFPSGRRQRTDALPREIATFIRKQFLGLSDGD